MTPELVTSRRAVLVSAGGTALAVCLAGCAAPGAGTPGGTSGGSTGGDAEATTVNVSEIPVGGGAIVGTFVVTQPTAGSFEAFSYFCTHEGFPVSQVTDAAIICGRHGSTFSLADGGVINGPATEPLEAATITQDGDTLTIS